MKITDYGAESLRISTFSGQPGILVLTDVFYPGWKAYVDGRETAVHRVNGLVRGIFLDRGRHEVVFAYRPASFTAGLYLLCLSLFVLLMAGLVKVAFRAPAPLNLWGFIWGRHREALAMVLMGISFFVYYSAVTRSEYSLLVTAE